MKLASWNVNSIKARLELVQRWLAENRPDVLMIQELKGLEFPEMEIKACGYEVCAVSQKGRNGVAVLSKKPVKMLYEHLPGMEDNEQARFQEVLYEGVRLINIYAPNGNPLDTEKFDYKLKWLDALYDHLKKLRQEREPFLIAGDFNIIPSNIDCHDPGYWQKDALFQPEAKKRFQQFLHLGLYDAFRALYPTSQEFTFWDYQDNAFFENKGVRIDHFLLSPPLSDRLAACTIDVDPRQWDRPSDHTPIIIELEDKKEG